ncbi:MAG: hypothetical protein BJ554DRAFT_8229, partial [Olpidium bornovanus]
FDLQFQFTDSPTNVQYEIWTNSTVSGNSAAGDIFGLEVISLVRTLDEAIVTFYNDPSALTATNVTLSVKDWPLIFRFSVFTDTNFMISWITFVLFGMGMVSAAFAITAVVRQARL